MKIVNFSSFMEFADDMSTRYKFYRVTDGKMQLYLFGRSDLVICTEVDVNQKIILEVVGKGFIETKLTDEEIKLFGLGE